MATHVYVLIHAAAAAVAADISRWRSREPSGLTAVVLTVSPDYSVTVAVGFTLSSPQAQKLTQQVLRWWALVCHRAASLFCLAVIDCLSLKLLLILNAPMSIVPAARSWELDERIKEAGWENIQKALLLSSYLISLNVPLETLRTLSGLECVSLCVFMTLRRTVKLPYIIIKGQKSGARRQSRVDAVLHVPACFPAATRRTIDESL